MVKLVEIKDFLIFGVGFEIIIRLFFVEFKVKWMVVCILCKFLIVILLLFLIVKIGIFFFFFRMLIWFFWIGECGIVVYIGRLRLFLIWVEFLIFECSMLWISVINILIKLFINNDKIKMINFLGLIGCLGLIVVLMIWILLIFLVFVILSCW